MVEKLESNGMKITYFSSAERVAQMHSHPYTQVHFGIEGEVDVWTEGGEKVQSRARR